MRIIDFFDKGTTLYPENIAFIDAESQYCYREANRETHSIASALHGNGFGKGTHVGILAPNSSIAFLALLGVYRTGAIWLPINPRNPPAVNADFMHRFDGELLLFHSLYKAEARQIVKKATSARQAVCIDDSSDFGDSLPEWQCHADSQFFPVEHSMDETLSIFPTGGTTGPSKRVVLTHRNVAASFAHFNYYDDIRHLVVAPMSHSAGVLGCMHFARGGTNVIMATVDPGGILQAIQEHAITHLFVPPTLLYMMLLHPDVALYDYSSLQHFLIGTAPTSLEKLKQAVEVFGPVITEAYSQSDVTPIAKF